MPPMPANAPAIPTTMRAARLAARGGPDQIAIDTVPVPGLGPDDALLAVHAAAITPSELGWEPTWTRPDGSDRSPITPSHEVAGEIVAVGRGVDGGLIGRRAFGLTDFYRDGAAAEYVAVRAADLADWPAALDVLEAAALPLSGLTAWQALFDHGRLEPDERVLIHGAAGGVGSFAVQLAHWRGAHVTALASAPDHALLKELGANVVLDPRSATAALDAAGGMDLVLDSVGGAALEASWRRLSPRGRIVSIAPTSRSIADRDSRGRFFIVAPDRGELVELADLVEGRLLRVIVERTFSLDETRQAYEYGLGEHPRGKVVIQVRG